MSAEEPVVKKQKVDEPDSTGSGDANGVSEVAKTALMAIDKVQEDIDQLNEKASDEILKVEQKYNQLRSPFYTKRSDLIKDIPNFWLTAFLNHPQISAIIREDEESALHALTTVEIEEFDDIKSGFRIKLGFSENEYFENDNITKEFSLGTDSPSSTTTTIRWKDGKQLIPKKRADDWGFFQWLVDNKDPGADDIAEVLKDDIWPNPLQYFLVPEVDEVDELEEDDDDEDQLEEVGDEAASGEENDENAS